MHIHTMTEPSMEEILGPGGIISRRLPGYEARPAQIEMATTVATALRERYHAVIEGGTGVGKSLAYLIPAIYSGKRVIISTANKALQDQLVSKDIPFLQHVLPRSVSAALVKGRANYLCLDHLDDEEHVQVMSGYSHDYIRLKEWANHTQSGDFEEMENLPRRELLTRVASTARTCIGNACLHFTDCFIEKMRLRAEDSQLIVCNHALLLADLMLRDMGAYLLPDRDAIIIDEAHRLEDAAISALTVSITRRELVDLAEHTLLRRYVSDTIPVQIVRLTSALFDPIELPALLNAQRSDERQATTQRLREELGAGLALATELEAAASQLVERNPFRDQKPPSKESKQYERLQEWTQRLAQDTRLVSCLNDSDCVRYIECQSSTRSVEATIKWTPISVSEPLAEMLFRQTPVISTSATLSIGDFSYYRQAVGIDAPPHGENPPPPRTVIELVAPSPFDYPRRCLLYIPSHLPEFRSSATLEYTAALCNEIEELVKASKGRAFLLFTSYRGLQDAYKALSPRLPYLQLKQGDAPRGELIRRFKSDGHAVLYGTKSFWEGIDIVGDTLSLVVIDRVPFTVPDDPVIATRVEQMKEEGEDWFNDLMLPNAILQLKQGVGRLLRSHDDRGVVAILDSRVARKSYGVRILRALPSGRQVHRLSDVQSFFS